MARVLHVIVGHSLPTYFLNAVDSVRRAAPADDLLVIDNASPEAHLREALSRTAAEHPNVEVLLRSSNDPGRNAKVGELYQAYEAALQHAFAGGYDYLHLLQGDMQMLWWDDDVVARAEALFESEPTCVNVHTILLSRDRRLTDELEAVEGQGAVSLRRYGLTDTGLYHLRRWQDQDIRFGQSETEHGSRYRSLGVRVLCHPWAPVAQIPWPAVVRSGAVKGREVERRRELLLRPLDPRQIADVKQRPGPTWLEDVCVPWGWTCLSPMWTTGLESIDYWVYRYRDARRNGLRRAIPRYDRRGIDGVPSPERRPSLRELLVTVPLREVASRLSSDRAPTPKER